MEKLKVTKEQLINLMVKFIKDCQKGMGDKNYIELPIEIHNWCSGFGRNSKWAHTDIEIGEYRDKKIYTFTDKEITDAQFVDMLRAAIAKAEIRGKVFADVCGDGYWSPKVTYFRRVEIYSKPCKEFNSLRKYIEKYAGFTLGEVDVFDVRVCGKRSSWSDSGRYDYLCYNANMCSEIERYIKANRTSKDKVSVKVEEYFSHGDETDYKIAQYQESEWYGYRGKLIVVEVTTPKGKTKAKNYWAMRRGV